MELFGSLCLNLQILNIIMGIKIKYYIHIFLISIILLILPFTVAAKDFTLVIDAGHGGKDKGALGRYAYEKDINLAVALKFGKMVESKMKDVKVVYTRDDDTYITLQGRADVANKASGDLFISIHTNSIDKKSKNRNIIKGSSTYTLGLHRTQENLEVAKRENSVIIMEDDYTTRYQGFDPNSSESYIIFEINQSRHLNQSISLASSIQNEFVSVAERTDKGVRQAGFWVLAATSMPSVLVELDFICNPDQEKFLTSESGQNKMAKALYNAFYKYKNSSDKKIESIVSAPDNNKLNNKTKQSKKKEEKAENLSNQSNEIYVESSYPSTTKTVSPDNYKYSVLKEEKSKKTKKTKKRENSNTETDTQSAGYQRQRTPVFENETETRSGFQTENTESSLSAKERDSLEDKRVESAFSKYNSGKKQYQDSESENDKKKDKTIYKIQLLSSAKIIPTGSRLLKSLNPVSYYKDKGVYKYTYGNYTSRSEAQKVLNKKIRPLFKEAFIVAFSNNKRIQE